MHWAGGTGEGDETTKVPQWWGIRTRDYAYVEIPGTGERELCDYVSDPYELTNHAAEPAYAAIRADLAAQLASLRAAQT